MRFGFILWDFNGTLLDDLRTGIDVENTMLARRGMPTLQSVADYYRVFGFPIRDYYVRLGYDFTRESYEALAVEFSTLYRAYEPTAPLREGVREAVEGFRRLGIPQSVLSASERGILTEQLSRRGLDGMFEEVLALDNDHADSKAHLAIRWRQRHPDVQALLIGDTDHDAAVAREAGICCVLVEGGHQGADALSRCGVPVCPDIPAVYRWCITQP
ncbi:MAG: HAD family hydrolase [Clostridiales bacterium]|nr:HAD family hydrolase [Clostridiales bacterium]